MAPWTPGSSGTPAVPPRAETGKKYVAISQYSDWLLAIYEDVNGLTHLEAIKNPGTSPEVFKNVPTDTGWKMVAAGNNHALALRSDGTLFAWGNNDFGQLKLPKTTTYHDIEAGQDFSLGLDSTSSIIAAGKNDAGQISGKPTGTGYMAIEAGNGIAAALTEKGQNVTWGMPVLGAEPPLDAGYTDLSLGPDYGFALQENVKEAAVTEPLSPDRTIRALDGTEVKIPMGSSFYHTHNDVTRVYAPDGSQILWANDANATTILFPSGTAYPATLAHYVPSGSRGDGTVDYTATVNTPGGLGGDVMTVTEEAWYDEQKPSVKATLPRAMCFAGKGCSAAVTTKKQTFLSVPLPASISSASTGTFTPVFSVHQLSDKRWVGTFSPLTADGSAASTESVSLVMDKNEIDPNQAVNFSIVSADWGNTQGQSLFVTAKANLTGGDSALHYTITGTSSVAVPEVSVIPRIYKQTPAGDVLVFTGPAQTCSSGKTCTIHGDFVPV